MARAGLAVMAKEFLTDFEAQELARNAQAPSDVVSSCWRRVIRAYAEVEEWAEAKECVYEMKKRHFSVPPVVWCQVLEACVKSKNTSIDDAIQLLVDMFQKDHFLPDKQVWNAAIDGLFHRLELHSSSSDVANREKFENNFLQLFLSSCPKALRKYLLASLNRSLLKKSQVRSAAAIVSPASSVVNLSPAVGLGVNNTDLSEWNLSDSKFSASGREMAPQTATGLMKYYSRRRDLNRCTELAEAHISEIENGAATLSNRSIDTMYFEHLIELCYTHSTPQSVIRYYDKMKNININCNWRIFGCAINAHTKLGDVESAITIVRDMWKADLYCTFNPDFVYLQLFNRLMSQSDATSDCKNLGMWIPFLLDSSVARIHSHSMTAEELVKELLSRKIKAVTVYKIFFHNLVKNKSLNSCVEFLNELSLVYLLDIHGDSSLVNGMWEMLLESYASLANCTSDDLLFILHKQQESEVGPSLRSHSVIIDYLCKHKTISEAIDYVKV